MESPNKLKLNDEQLKKLQSELLDLLIEFDRICTKHDMPYFLYAGTLLGAVRHEGFIPWDDDIDVAMYREDYNKFKRIAKEEINTREFFFQTQQTDENYNWVFGRIRKENTLYMRTGQEHLKHHNGIFMDIFPLDDISENKLKQYITLYACKICKKVLWAPVGKKSGENFFYRTLFRVLNWVPRRLAIALYEFFAIKINRKQTSLIASHNAYSIVLKKDLYKKNIKMEFEGYEFNAPANYHEFLEARYGDYMKLPPKHERQGHHYVSYIRFSDGSEVR